MSKNTRNRILLTALAALLLVTLTIGGTMAWLADDSETITNTFNPTEIEVLLTEDNPADRLADMVPGATITKDPKVSLSGDSQNAWVFVKVTESADLGTYIEYDPDDDLWFSCGGNVWVYHEPLTANGEAYFLETVKVKEEVTSAQMEAAEGNEPTLTFQAYALQSEHLKLADGTEITTDNIQDNAAAVWALVDAN